jgi:hypothetical protein
LVSNWEVGDGPQELEIFITKDCEGVGGVVMVKGWACCALEEASEVIEGGVEWLQDLLLKVSGVPLRGGRVGHRYWKRWCVCHE